MQTKINTQPGQFYNYLGTAWVKLLQPCAVNPNPAYNQNNEMNYWDCIWYEHKQGKLWQSEKIAQLRFDGFGNPQLVNELPADKKHYYKLLPSNGGGCDGHRYATFTIHITATDEQVATVKYYEYKYTRLYMNDGTSIELANEKWVEEIINRGLFEL